MSLTVVQRLGQAPRQKLRPLCSRNIISMSIVTKKIACWVFCRFTEYVAGSDCSLPGRRLCKKSVIADDGLSASSCLFALSVELASVVRAAAVCGYNVFVCQPKHGSFLFK